MAGDERTEVRNGLEACLPRLWRYAYVLSRNAAEADDLTQAACLRAIERAAQFIPGTRLDRWLFAILRSIWLNQLRAERIREGEGRVDAEATLWFDGARAVETNILAAQVLMKLGALPAAQRETALLVYAEGYSYAEAAAMLAIPVGTVMSRLAAVRAAISKDLNERPEREP
jgi:RNA polymerase sigma-70 factor (ECF subfamily)